MKIFVVPILIALGLLTRDAHAEALQARPGIIGEDNREAAVAADGPWTAIGHVNVSGYRSVAKCTGTRIAPGVVLTSAHCVINPVQKTVIPAQDIHFVAGVNRDRSIGNSTARCVLLPDDLKLQTYTHVPTTTSLSHDIALLVLDDDIVSAGVIAPLQGKPLPVGSQVWHAGYPADRRMVLTMHKNCSVLGNLGTLVTTDCDTVAGSSGGPLLIQQSGEWRVAAIMGATTNAGVNLAVPLSIWPDMPLDGKCK
jgi:protease YdgD